MGNTPSVARSAPSSGGSGTTSSGATEMGSTKSHTDTVAKESMSSGLTSHGTATGADYVHFESDRTIVDLARDVAALAAAASSTPPSAASAVVGAVAAAEVGKDLIGVGKGTAEPFINDRTDAVKGGYAKNSDVGFQ